MRKGIILAGGKATRLFPLTISTNKQFLPVYDKPMIYYPLSTLILTGLEDILIITNPEQEELFQKLLGNGREFGVNLSYAIQQEAGGIAQALIIAKKFLNNSSSALILGDNIFHGESFQKTLQKANNSKESTIFGCYVNNPSSYGVIEKSKSGNIIGIKEKPKFPKTNYAVPGLYFYDEDAPHLASSLIPSKRGELEITDLNNKYIKMERINIDFLEKGFSWFDTGTPESLIDASNYIRTYQDRHSTFIGSPHETAYLKGFINEYDLKEVKKRFSKSLYGKKISMI